MYDAAPGSLIGKPVQIRNPLVVRHHVPQVDVDVEQVHQMHDIAPLANGVFGNDHVESIGRITATCVDTMAGAQPRDD